MKLNRILIAFIVVTVSLFAQHPPSGGGHATHGHAGHNEHIHKTLHPHMHLHKKNYVNAIKAEFGFNTATYFGETCDGKECLTLRPSLQVGASYRYNKRWMFRSQLNYFMISSKDANRGNDSRNLSFLTHGIELNVGAVYDIIKFEPLYFRRLDILPYLHAGLGVLQFTPTTKFQGEWYRLRPLQTENKKYSSFAAVIPFGAGLRWKLLDHWDLCTEIGMRLTTTDYLDDISGKYVVKPFQTKEQLESAIANPTKENLHVLLSDRSWEINKSTYNKDAGTYDYKDMYYYHYAWENGESKLVDPAKDGSYRSRGNKSKRDNYLLLTVRLEYTVKVTKQRDVSFHRAFNPRFRARKR
ncbi:MAG: DUF6089 family protein [Cytophagales bacterium]